jgi:hypothetical protein
MKIYVIMCFDGIEETNIYAIYKHENKATDEAKAMNNKENSKGNKIKNEYYVDEWNVLA